MIRDLIRSFSIQRPRAGLFPPCWDLAKVPVALRSPPFVSYVPDFVAKTESEQTPIPHFFLFKSLEGFVGDLEQNYLFGLVGH